MMFLMKMNSVVLWTFFVLVVLIGVYGVGADKVSVSVKEGESVTLHTNVIINQDETIYWFYQDTRIAEVDNNVRKICTDDKCKERFRDRLQLDHQTGSLNITNTRTTDSGLYHVMIIGFGRDSEKTFNVTVDLSVTDGDKDTMKGPPGEEGESDSGRSQAPVAVIVVVVLLTVAAAAGGGVMYLKRHKAGRNGLGIV